MGGWFGGVREEIAQEASLSIDVGSGKQRRLAAKDRAAAKASSADHRTRASSRTNSAACGGHRPPKLNAEDNQATSVAMCDFGVSPGLGALSDLQSCRSSDASVTASSGTGLASDRASDTSMPSTTSPQPGSKLWVCPSFGTFSDMQAAPAVRPLSRRGTAHQCGVNGQQKQAIRNDFYASLVLADRDNIEITHQGVHRESSARLPAYSGRRPLNWAPTRAQHTRPWARGKVISEGIMRLATPHLAAVRRSRRNRRARNSGGSRLSSGEVGRAVKTRAAYGACKSSRAAEEASSSRVDGLGRGTLPATRAVKLWLALDERARLFSVERVVPAGRRFKTTCDFLSAVSSLPASKPWTSRKGERAVAFEQGWEGVGPRKMPKRPAECTSGDLPRNL
eukprot:s383_g3.t1